MNSFFTVNVTCQADYDDQDSFINDLFGINDLDGEIYVRNRNYVSFPVLI